MIFNSTGEFRMVLQQYTFGSLQMICAIKILPDVVKLYKKEPQNDYNWMTAARWNRLESCLQRTLAGISHWKREARKLKAELQVDNFKVSIKATEEYLPAIAKLLSDDKLSQKNLGLEIVLQYMSHEDIVIQIGETAAATRTQLVADEKSSSSRSRKTKDTDHKTSASSRNRRSTSLDSHRKRSSELVAHTSRGTRTSKRKKSPRSRSNSVEAKQERRSPRSPMKTDRYKEYVMGKENARKHKTKDAAVKVESTSKIVQSAPTSKPSPIVYLNGETLRKINEMLEVPKPKEVPILLLEDMDEATVLGTFETYRDDFDQVFEQRQHKFQTQNYMSIDHCHVMDILNETIRDNMIKKLGEFYCKSGPHGSLIINALLPLWIIRLFMSKYKFSEDEAVRQIADQLKYITYLKAVNNDPLCFD